MKPFRCTRADRIPRALSRRFIFRHHVNLRHAMHAAVLIVATTGVVASAAIAENSPFTAKSTAATADESPFMAESDAAMANMMTAMQIPPSGDVDVDFVAMMVPHHQGAIDMARAELRYGRNEQLRRMAQEVIVTQLDEIAAMRLALGQSVDPSLASPTPAQAEVPPTTDHTTIHQEH
jgi:uncharacterized protein (DUF305 family)